MHINLFLPIESGSMATRGHLSSEDDWHWRLLEFSTGLLITTDYKVTSRVWACSSVFFKNHRWQSTLFICDLSAFLAESASSFWPCVTVAFPQQATLLSEAFISCVLDEGWPSLIWQHHRGLLYMCEEGVGRAGKEREEGVEGERMRMKRWTQFLHW